MFAGLSQIKTSDRFLLSGKYLYHVLAYQQFFDCFAKWFIQMNLVARLNSLSSCLGFQTCCQGRALKL